MGNSHTNLAKFMHWGFIVLYTYGVLKQIEDLSQLENLSLLIFEVIFAILFLAIVLVRYFYMKKFKTFLGANEQIPVVHTLIAKVIHSSIYLCLILLPISGLVIAGLFSQGIKDGPIQEFVIAIHSFSASLSYILILVHIFAAFFFEN